MDYQKTQRSNLEQKLKEIHAVVLNGQLKRTFVREVKVIPQPMGIFFHHYLDESLNPTDLRWKRQRVGIVDIGYGTTDIAVVDGGQYIGEYSRSSNLAMSRLTRLVSNAVYRDISVFQFLIVFRDKYSTTVSSTNVSSSISICSYFLKMACGNAVDF